MGSKTKTKTTVAPPSWGQQYVTGALGAEQQGLNAANQTLQQYSPQQNAAINFAYNNLENPAPFTTDSRNLLDSTVNGNFLSPSTNPYSAAMGKQIADQTQGEYNSTFGGSGRAHGGMAALLSSQGVGNALDNFYGNIYEQERSRQQQAMMAEPAFNSDQYTAANAMFPEISSTAMGPLQAAALYGNSVGTTLGPYGSTSTTQSTPFGLQQALGLGMMAAGAFIPGAQPLMGMGAGMMGGNGSYGASPFGMAGLLAPTASPINVGSGTANYFAANPFGG